MKRSQGAVRRSHDHWSDLNALECALERLRFVPPENFPGTTARRLADSPRQPPRFDLLLGILLVLTTVIYLFARGLVSLATPVSRGELLAR